MFKPKKIVAFDILGPAYHYDGAKGWREEGGAVKTLLDKIKEFGYAPKTTDEEAIVEEEMMRKGQTKIYITPGFMETAIYTQKQGALPIIISAGTPRCFEKVLEAGARDYKDRLGELINPEMIFPQEHRHTTVGIGSKKKPEIWNEIVNDRYGKANILTTYEDTYANLEAAMKGIGGDGFFVVSHSNGLRRLDTKIYKGTMYELFPVLAERLKQ